MNAYILILTMSLTMVSCRSEMLGTELKFFDKKGNEVLLVREIDITEVLVDSTSIKIRVREGVVHKISKSNENMTLGRVDIFCLGGKKYSVKIIDVYQALAEPCPHIYSDRNGVIITNGFIIIDRSKKKSKCNDDELFIGLAEVFENWR
jgi:hypothetical protein